MTTKSHRDGKREGGGADESKGVGRMILYSGPLSMFGAKAEIAAARRGSISASSWCRSR